MSKLGLHCISWNHSQEILDFIAGCQPRVIKLLDFNDIDMDAARASSPGTLFIGRQYVENQPLDNPARNARDFFNAMQPAIQKMGPRMDVWEGYNEIVLSSVDDAKRYNDFTVAWADLMHGQGLRCAAYSFSTGNPDIVYWQYLAGGARACDYLALHEYSSPRMTSYLGDLCLRYRRVRAALPADAYRPILITECGIDDGQGNGWMKFTSGDDYISQLAWYDSELSRDDYVVGATIFTVDSGNWKYFELLPILKPLANYIVTHPSPEPPPPPPPPSQPSISAVTLGPLTLPAGELLQVSMTVVNNTTQTLQTMGPDPGFVYDEGDTFQTRGFVEVANTFRVGLDFAGREGIDHPYRWGFGQPLAPGSSVNLTGAVRLKNPQSRYYWAGLVQEQIAWLQDRVGRELVTVNPPPAPTGAPTITSVSISPASLAAGEVLSVSVTVRNDSSAELQTMGPDPGLVYTEGDTFRSRGFTEQTGVVRVGVDFDGRTGIDHPYRWGLGATLAPGASTTVTGGIRLVGLNTRNYWAGLVKENIAWLQDNQGNRSVTVTAPVQKPPPPMAGKVSITGVTFSPTEVAKGSLLQVSVTIANNTNATLETQGPDPGFVYLEGEDFWAKQYPPVAGAFRIGVDYEGRAGIDHPYRWGLRVSLRPGETTVVTGFVRLNNPGTKKLWVGLVQEWIALLQDQQGVTSVTVK